MNEDSRKYLDKADRAMHATQLLVDGGDYEFAAGRVYYAMFYTAQALLHDRDLVFRKHAGVHAAFGKHFAKPGTLDPKYHRWLLDAFTDRLSGDYDIGAQIDREAVVESIKQASEFLEDARRFLKACG